MEQPLEGISTFLLIYAKVEAIFFRRAVAGCTQPVDGEDHSLKRRSIFQFLIKPESFMLMVLHYHNSVSFCYENIIYIHICKPESACFDITVSTINVLHVWIRRRSEQPMKVKYTRCYPSMGMRGFCAFWVFPRLKFVLILPVDGFKSFSARNLGPGAAHF